MFALHACQIVEVSWAMRPDRTAAMPHSDSADRRISVLTKHVLSSVASHELLMPSSMPAYNPDVCVVIVGGVVLDVLVRLASEGLQPGLSACLPTCLSACLPACQCTSRGGASSAPALLLNSTLRPGQVELASCAAALSQAQ